MSNILYFLVVPRWNSSVLISFVTFLNFQYCLRYTLMVNPTGSTNKTHPKLCNSQIVSFASFFFLLNFISSIIFRHELGFLRDMLNAFLSLHMPLISPLCVFKYNTILTFNPLVQLLISFLKNLQHLDNWSPNLLLLILFTSQAKRLLKQLSEHVLFQNKTLGDFCYQQNNILVLLPAFNLLYQ